MLRVARRVVLLALGHATPAFGQHPASPSHALDVRGDTSGAPPSCSASTAVAALKGWFAAVSAGDTAAIRANVSPTFEVFSAGRNGVPEPFFRGDQYRDLVAYVTRRARAHERLVLRRVVFNGWHGRRLWFGPVAVERTADDLPGGVHMVIGKGVYECQRGLHALNTAPWPENIPPFRP
jgi:hypothetical protein